MKKIIALATLLFPVLGLAAPVDGYKDLKFGMSWEEVKNNNKLCESEWHLPEENNPIKVVAGFFICDKFAFNTSYVRAELRFIGNKLELITLSMPEYPSYPKDKLIPLLTQKYGKPEIIKEDLIEQEIKAGKKKKRSKNESLIAEKYKFANGTVSLTVYNENGKDDLVSIYYKSTTLIHSSAEQQEKAKNQFLLNEL